MKKIFTLTAMGLLAASLHAEPKKLLVVTTTTGFRHSSISTAERVLSQLAQQSGEFTVDFVEQPPSKPNEPKKPASDASDADQAAYKAAEATYQTDEATWEVSLRAALQKLS